jgi:formylglycine-generating enzyme required for sulfatase activity
VNDTIRALQSLVVHEPGGVRALGLPCRIGGVVGDDVIVPDVSAGTSLLLQKVDGDLVVSAIGVGGAINGVLLLEGALVVLQPGDVITLGSARILLRFPATHEYSASLEVRHLVGNDTVSPVDFEGVESRESVDDERVTASMLEGVGPTEVSSNRLQPTEEEHANRRLFAIAAMLLVVFGIFAIFLSRLETVLVTVSPAEADVRGSGFGWRSGDSLLLLPGERRISAELEGYLPVERRIEVRKDEPLSLELRLAPKPGILEIDTGGVSATVFIDGAEAGVAPGDIEVPGGTRTLTLRAERHLEHIETVEVQGKGVRQPLGIKLRPSWGSLDVSTTSTGASLTVDDGAAVLLPAKIDLPAGLHRLRISAGGAKDWRSAVLVRAGEVQRIGPIELGAPDARLRVTSSPSTADITVGGVFRGRTPATVELPAGATHELTISLQGYGAATREVFAEAGRESALAVTLRPIPVQLTLQGDPTDVEVRVAGQSKGRTPLTLELPARKHTLELRKEGMQDERIDVDLSSNVDRTVDYKMIPVGRSRDWKPPPPALRAQSGTLLRLISGGSFTMGSERREQGRRANEFARKITLTRPFYLGTREVTNGEFRRFKADHASGFIGKRTLDLDTQPVSNVGWSDAVEYCNWLSAQEGLPVAYQKKDGRWVLIQPMTTGYRLPTEAEWEFAARHPGVGARTQRYEWGDALPPPAGIGNLAGAEAVDEMTRVLEGWQDDYQVVAPPGKFKANGLGIFDMTGNVSEWVHDVYVSFDANAGGMDPTGPAEGGNRHVVKGSNWRTATFADLRAAWREGVDNASQDIGFRVARYAE